MISVSNAGMAVSQRIMQSKRKAKGSNKMASKNTGNESVSVADMAYQSESVAEFTAWLDDESNYAKRKVNGKEVMARRTCSLSANVPDDIYYDFVQLAAADKTELEDGAMTYAVRAAVWAALGRDAEYAEWAKTEAERISTERSVRMSGAGKERAEKVRSLETDNQRMAAELAELKAMLANMQKAS